MIAYEMRSIIVGKLGVSEEKEQEAELKEGRST